MVYSAIACPDRSARCDQRLRHAQQHQSRARGLRQRGVAGGLDRQVFLLRAQPFRVEQVDQRRAGGDHVAGRTRIDAFDEAGTARLHDADVAVVERHRAHGLDHRAQAAPLDAGQAQPQRLLGLCRDRQRAALARAGFAFVGIARHQLHVHEGRLAGLVEALRRHHRVVPVEHLAFAGRSRGRGHGVGNRRVPRLPLAQGPARQTAQPQQQQSRCHALKSRRHGVHSATRVLSRTRSAARCASRSIRRRRASTASRRAISTALRSARPAS